MIEITDKHISDSEIENFNNQATIINDIFTYQGEFKDEKINGYGKLFCYNSFSYHGNFKNNNMEGKGIMYHNIPNNEGYDDNTPIYYNGQFESNQKNGYGVEKYFNNEYYEGHFFNGFKNGKGILFNQNGTVKIKGIWNLGASIDTKHITTYYKNGNLKYKGEYNGKVKHGKGVFCLENGNILFDGLFKDDEFVEGKLYGENNKLLFEGIFNHEIPNEGKFYHGDTGNVLCTAKFKYNLSINYKCYKGYLESNKTEIFSDDGKSYFKGKLIESEIELNSTYNGKSYKIPSIKISYKDIRLEINVNLGSGILLYPNGIIRNVINVDENNKLNGQLIANYENGNLKHNENYKNNILHGRCIYYYENQNIEKDMIFDNGDIELLKKYYYSSNRIMYEGKCNSFLRYEGFGKLYFDTSDENHNLQYEGNFLNGKFHGDGTLYNTVNKKYEGGFHNGKKHGDGTSYYDNSNIEYIGKWESNEKHGTGELYSDTGDLVFSGQFHYDEIQYDAALEPEPASPPPLEQSPIPMPTPQLEQTPNPIQIPLMQGPLPSPILINSIIQGWGGNEPEPLPQITPSPNQNLFPEPLQEPIHHLQSFSSDSETESD
tara:strand:+ start:2064 stop:3869 length:1806 start_codon:yes stop_codon:yes gene_type:complete